MTSQATPRNDIRFGIDNCHVLYKKLKFEDSRLNESYAKSEELNDYDTYSFDAFNFFVTASHLHWDWLKNDTENRPTLAEEKKNVVNNSSNGVPSEMQKILKAIKDITNGSKHIILNRYLDNLTVNSISPPEIASFYSWFFGPEFGIRIGQLYFTLGELQTIVMGYFAWIFDDTVDSSSFPAAIKAQITHIRGAIG